MSRARLLAFCRSLPHVTQDIKWEDHLVFSVGGKMFASFDAAGGPSVGFKTEPGIFAQLTQTPGIVPTPYAARFHWVTVKDPKALPLTAVRELIGESYRLVFEGLSGKTRRALNEPAAAPKPSPKRKRAGLAPNPKRGRAVGRR